MSERRLEVKLSDCPKCGSEDVKMWTGAERILQKGRSSRTCHKVRCGDCEAETDVYEKRSDAEAAWDAEQILGEQDGKE